MRKISLFILLSFLSILLVPAASAAVTDKEILLYLCEYTYSSNTFTGGGTTGAVFQEDRINFNGNLCGEEANPATHSLEKGDCTEAGAIISEISEPLGPGIKLNENEKIVDVYKGICCLTPIYEEVCYKDGNPKNKCDEGEHGVPEIIGCKQTRNVYQLTFDDCSKVAAHCEKRQWLIATSGVGIIKVFVKQIYIFGAGFVGLSALIAIIVSGIQISVSGVSGDITSAKERIIQAIAGLVILFLSGLILYTINPTFFS